jgi:hypothetical protein
MNKSCILYYAIGLLTIFHLSIAKAEGTQNELLGVWRGTLGQQEIVACWDHYGGNYYKLRKPLRIALNNTKNSDVWLENEWEKSEETISWQLNKPIDKHLVGSQIQSSTGTTLPIMLNRIHSSVPEDDKEECNFSGAVYEAFNTPRLKATQIHYGDSTNFMNTKYRVINALNGDIVSIELIGTKDSFTKANSVLHKEFMNDVLGYLTCDEFEPPRQGDYQSKIRLRFINNEWLSWSGHLEGYCGGAHPFFGSSTTTINLHTGDEINLWDWFNLVKKEENDQENQDDDVDSIAQVCEFLSNRCLPRPLSELVINTPASYEDKDCKDVDFQGMVDDGYSIGLNERGIAFIPELVEPARGMRTCYANYTIPFTKLAPFLSKKGAEAINQILLHSSDITK